MVNPEEQAQADMMIQATVEAEVDRLKWIRREQGEFTWANALGSLIVTQLSLMSHRFNPEAQSVARTGELTLKALTPQIMELYRHPLFGGGMAAGVIEELVTRHYLDVDERQLRPSLHRR